MYSWGLVDANMHLRPKVVSWGHFWRLIVATSTNGRSRFEIASKGSDFVTYQ
jgi:hypothetical protein